MVFYFWTERENTYRMTYAVHVLENGLWSNVRIRDNLFHCVRQSLPAIGRQIDEILPNGILY